MIKSKIKDIKIKIRAYYFSGNIINITNFDLNNIKRDEKLYKDIIIYCIIYVTIKDQKSVRNNSANAS